MEIQRLRGNLLALADMLGSYERSRDGYHRVISRSGRAYIADKREAQERLLDEKNAVMWEAFTAENPRRLRNTAARTPFTQRHTLRNRG